MQSDQLRQRLSEIIEALERDARNPAADAKTLALRTAQVLRLLVVELAEAKAAA